MFVCERVLWGQPQADAASRTLGATAILGVPREGRRGCWDGLTWRPATSSVFRKESVRPASRVRLSQTSGRGEVRGVCWQK